MNRRSLLKLCLSLPFVGALAQMVPSNELRDEVLEIRRKFMVAHRRHPEAGRDAIHIPYSRMSEMPSGCLDRFLGFDVQWYHGREVFYSAYLGIF